MKIAVVIIAIILVAGFALGFAFRNVDDQEILMGFTVEEVAEHNNPNDCWTIVDGRVYDITRYIPIHPGGSEILRACGQDASSFFNSRLDEQGETIGSGEPHSSSARSILSEYLIGELN